MPPSFLLEYSFALADQLRGELDPNWLTTSRVDQCLLARYAGDAAVTRVQSKTYDECPSCRGSASCRCDRISLSSGTSSVIAREDANGLSHDE